MPSDLHVPGTPNGIRTRAATLKGWCPRPLDDGGLRGARLRTLANGQVPLGTLRGVPDFYPRPGQQVA